MNDRQKWNIAVSILFCASAPLNKFQNYANNS